ncbi:hypothetical protein MSG28_005328 [Choristoneura fumiferana]|uniref:Uncharacterized protein n=1 Tax=Choristoneura fumiferana TaxID=7141 RepID=A0ACC0JQT6_CHOFU|nr:hypothetical protein MSG28_005328 [Choristoneura fumiferana]
MDKPENKKLIRKQSSKAVFGIKLPPIEKNESSREVKTILDVDPDYFSLVEGRKIRPSTSMNKYKEDIKNVALKRTLRGYLVDEILRIDREIETERSIYETASTHFDEYQHSFDKFLADDNNKTIAIMQKSDSLAKDLVNQTEEHKQANYEMATLRSKLQYIDETLLILLSFENFLHTVSPILWQEGNNVELGKKHSEIITIDSNIFVPVNKDLVTERLSQLSAPKLYFETPEQLSEMFDLLERQNLNYLLATEELNAEKNKLLKARDLFKESLRQELDFIQKKIEGIETIIASNENREVEVKEIFYRILADKLKYLVSSETALQIFNYVEYAYEQLIAPNDTRLNSVQMTRALENEFDNLMLDLSAYDLELVKAVEHETYQNETKNMKQAKEAAKLLKDVDKLNRRLKSSYEPTRRIVYD